RKPGTDPENVQMSDVLCDFCHREWTEDVPMIEGHHGSCMCGHCLTVAWTEVVLGGATSAPDGFACTMCLEQGADRRELNRADEPGWQSPAYPDAAVCRRCIKLAAGALHKDPDHEWARPG
ncbi:MAG: hypothetical protein ACYTGG_12860, partial [Planctomycetota bacterium]